MKVKLKCSYVAYTEKQSITVDIEKIGAIVANSKGLCVKLKDGEVIECINSIEFIKSRQDKIYWLRFKGTGKKNYLLTAKLIVEIFRGFDGSVYAKLRVADKLLSASSIECLTTEKFLVIE